MNRIPWMAAVAGGVLAALVACEQKSADSGGAAPTAGKGTADRCPHDIKQEKCPFCHPEMVEADGFCGEHGVAEALCYKCRPYLNAAFRAKGDWCDQHKAPKSQCVDCNPALKENRRPGEHESKAPAGKG